VGGATGQSLVRHAYLRTSSRKDFVNGLSRAFRAGKAGLQGKPPLQNSMYDSISQIFSDRQSRSMSLKRRQFLMLMGSVGGFSLSACVGGFATQNDTSSRASKTTPETVGEVYPADPPAPTQASRNALDPARGDVRIVVISDLNSQYGSTDYEPEVDKAIALIPGWQPNLVLCGGDMVAGQQPSLTEPQIRAMWAAFDRHVGAPLRQANLPYGFTVGNHDASSATALHGGFLFERERNLAAAHWNNPQHNPGLNFVDRADFPFYYTFQQDEIFFLVWDASSAQIPAEQIAWVDRSLASPAAQTAKMRIAIGHLPLYAVAIGREDPGEYLNDAEQLRSLLEQHNVHTYISGHDHVYYPGHVGQLELLHCGILGSGMRPLLNGNLQPQKTLTIVDVKLDLAETLYTTYDMQTMELVNQQTLPRLIVAPTGKVLRRDLKWEDLTPQEQSTSF
jgi:hypothetical protein